MNDVVRIKLHISTGFAGCDHTDVLEIDRAEWEALTPEQQQARLDEEIIEFRGDKIECAAWVMEEDEED